tara:strand:+ start:317 stop:523 length:207 start_codon:yes stop_codon:yes gene_type:complete
MSQIPEKEHSEWARKNFSSNIWDWTDRQLKKLMDDKEELEKENKKLKKYVETLESQVHELNHTLAGRR